MNQGPTEQPVRATKKIPWHILFAVTVAAIFVSAGYYLMVQDSVVELTITDGSVTGTIQGDFFDTIEANAIYSYFNATTCAERTDRPTSTLTLRIVAITHWEDSFNAVETGIILTIVGCLDSELDARSLEIVCNQTAYSTTMESLETTRQVVNISLEPSANGPDIRDTESATLEVELVNRTADSPIYEFSLSNNFLVHAFGEDNLADRFICIRAVVNGNLEPEFSVSVSILMVNTSVVS